MSRFDSIRLLIPEIQTAALDHNIGLSQTQRTLSRTRSTLLSELTSIQSSRRHLALQHDRVRAAHDVAAREARSAAELDSMLHDIELAVQRGRRQQRHNRASSAGTEADGEVGLELRLADVVTRVSSADGRTGLAERLKRFNGFLEAFVRMPSSVEG